MEEGTRADKMPPPDWPICIFLIDDWCGRALPTLGSAFLISASVPALGSCPDPSQWWSDIQENGAVNPFSPSCFWSAHFITATGKSIGSLVSFHRPKCSSDFKSGWGSLVCKISPLKGILSLATLRKSESLSVKDNVSLCCTSLVISTLCYNSDKAHVFWLKLWVLCKLHKLQENKAHWY